MARFDLIIKGATVVSSANVSRCDIGVSDDKIAAIGNLNDAAQIIDANGKIVFPGGIETHCHIEQESATGAMTSDDYYTGSVSAAFGGNTSIVPFAAQHRGQKIPEVLALYDSRAAPKSVIDYSYHLIVSDPTEDALARDLPAAIARGVTSFKVFTTYDKLKITDAQFLAVLGMAKSKGGLTMVHAEDDATIKAATARLLDAGQTAPKYHADSHPAEAEVKAVHHAIGLARQADAPLMFVHISTDEGACAVAAAREAGQPIIGETCPQYMFLTADDLDREDGAKFICSPPLRDAATQEALWTHLLASNLQLYSSDHAPYRYDKTGKLSAGPNPPFNKTANGLPGIELRLPLLFSEGVGKGRINLQEFAALSAGNAARIFGMDHCKGDIAPGYDADIAIWDPDRSVTVTSDVLHDNMDYTPFEGWQITGWPETVINRGRVVVDKGKLRAKAGDGDFIARRRFEANRV